MVLDQKGCCAICLKNPESGRLQVDHDHVTKEIRELLCHRHNKALGLFDDDPALLERAAAYLRRHSRQLEFDFSPPRPVQPPAIQLSLF